MRILGLLVQILKINFNTMMIKINKFIKKNFLVIWLLINKNLKKIIVLKI